MTLYGSPSSIDIGSGESIPVNVDFTELLKTGQAVAAGATCTLTDVTSQPTGPDGSPSTLANPATQAGNVVTQQIVAASLAVGHVYRLVATATVTGTSPAVIWQIAVNIVCVF